MFDEDAKGWIGYLRCYVEVPDSVSAQPAADQIAALLTPFVDPILMPIEQYEKIPEYQRVLFRWKLDEFPQSVHHSIQSAFATTWYSTGDNGRIWDFRVQPPLEISGVRWMDLDFYPASSVWMTDNDDISN